MSLRFIAITTFIIFSLSGCSFFEADVKDYMKCGYVAGQLEQNDAAEQIANSMGIYIKENRVSINDWQLLAISQNVQDELGLYALNKMGKLNKLLDVYNSSTCQGMHTQGKVSPNMYY